MRRRLPGSVTSSASRSSAVCFSRSAIVGLQAFKRRLDLDFDFIRDAAEFRALVFRKLSEILKFESEKTGFAGEVAGPGVF